MCEKETSPIQSASGVDSKVKSMHEEEDGDSSVLSSASLSAVSKPPPFNDIRNLLDSSKSLECTLVEISSLSSDERKNSYCLIIWSHIVSCQALKFVVVIVRLTQLGSKSIHGFIAQSWMVLYVAHVLYSSQVT